MSSENRIRFGLAAKLALWLVASTGAFLALFGYIMLREQRRHSEELVLQAADRISDVILRSTNYEMMHNDREALYNIIREIGTEPGIRRIRIFNKEGRIRFSSDATELNRVVDKHAEACYGCHARQAPLVRLARPDRARIFTDAQGRRLLGVIRPIYNAPACSNGGCHAHTPEQQVLGVIDANLSLASVDERMAEQQGYLVMITAAAVVLVSMLSVAFIWAFVHRPVKELIHGTHRVSGGDLGYRLPVRSQDELGDLAASFNKMSADLAYAHAEITGWTHTLEERVERKTQELEGAHRSLLRSEKLASIGKLAATVAHEVNNPLFGILTYARLTLRELEKSDMPAAAKTEMLGQLRIIERESHRCGEILRNLLTFARQSPSRRSLNQVNEIVERALALVRHKLDLQGKQFSAGLAADLPAISCDANQLQQVVLILLVNATEAMPRGGSLHVSTALDAAAGCLRIRVQDSGVGIPPELLPQIFDPFFTTKEDQQRTGLGLAVGRSIVEQHGGEITVHSVQGQGTEFTVSLPAGQDAGSASPAHSIEEATVR